ncbi:hypothetical protein ElyMa_003857700 [Elysia marginata]|uniref:Uncharacterized protein n=1 Tax=Elysia marginata TaxID=1093978 RepID=A0AAV4FJN0_9GAST|nr:hypothetical protein ElyMa_003857700 [Elysia marginata]
MVRQSLDVATQYCNVDLEKVKKKVENSSRNIYLFFDVIFNQHYQQMNWFPQVLQRVTVLFKTASYGQLFSISLLVKRKKNNEDGNKISGKDDDYDDDDDDDDDDEDDTDRGGSQAYLD